jgi:hypothetical protein
MKSFAKTVLAAAFMIATSLSYNASAQMVIPTAGLESLDVLPTCVITDTYQFTDTTYPGDVISATLTYSLFPDGGSSRVVVHSVLADTLNVPRYNAIEDDKMAEPGWQPTALCNAQYQSYQMVPCDPCIPGTRHVSIEWGSAPALPVSAE